MAWELANQPRCPSDKTGAALNAWIAEMSAFIKSQDTNHLVTTGIDGGYLDKGSNPWAWWYKGNEGQDYLGNHRWPSVDFATFHYYPSMDYTVDAGQWISEHIQDAHALIGKPVLFGEFDSLTDREASLAAWYGVMETNAVDGDTFWMLADRTIAGNNDGYFIFYPDDTNLCRIVSAHAAWMNGR